MSQSSVNEMPEIDARVSPVSLAPTAPRGPEPPLRLTLAPTTEADERDYMRQTLRAYVRRFGPSDVIAAVQEIAGGGQ